MPPLRREHRQAAETLDAAEAGGTPEDLEPVEEALAAGLPAADVDADHAAVAAHLTLRQRVIGMRFEAGVIDLLDAAALLRLEPARDEHRVRVVAHDAHRERLQPAPDRVRGLRIDDATELAADAVDPAQERRGAGERAGRDVTVA